MRNEKRMNFEELQEPGMRRVLEGFKLLQEEAPDLLDKATIAAKELAKNRGDGGRTPQ